MNNEMLQNLSKGQQVAAGGALSALIAVFLPWFTISSPFASFSAKGTDFSTGLLGLLLLLAGAAVMVAPAFGKNIGKDASKGAHIALVAAGLGGIIWLLRFAFAPGPELGRGFGVFVGAAAVAAVVGGIVMTMKEQNIAMPTAADFSSMTNGVKTDTPAAAPTQQYPGVQQHPTPQQYPAPAPQQYAAPVAPAPQQHAAPQPAPQQHAAPQPAPQQHAAPVAAPQYAAPVPQPAPQPAPNQGPTTF